MSILDDPRVKSLLQMAAQKKEELERGKKENELQSDIMKFDSGFRLPDVSIFDRVKLDAGGCMSTQSITMASKENMVDGPYFKVDKHGRTRMNPEKMVIQSTATKGSMDKHKIDTLVVRPVADRIPTKSDKTADKTETLGPKWFDMKAAEITPEIKKDLLIIKNRAALDPKAFYKRDNSKKLPKFFQVGTVIESKADFYSDRMTNRQRKETLVDGLLQDHTKKTYLKRKFLEIQAAKKHSGKGSYKLKKKRR